MANSILSITGKLTSVAELIMDIDPEQIPAEELAVLKDRLPAWTLTLNAINASLGALEASLFDVN